MVIFSSGGDIEKLTTHLKSIGLKLGQTERRLIAETPERLILWYYSDQIVGHAIWHSSNTKIHPDGEPRDPEEKKILEQELEVEGDFIELHEIWLADEYRGRGFGSEFFKYFENVVTSKGFKVIVYYADDPTALNICLKRGYKKAWGVDLEGINGEKSRYYILAKHL